MLYNICHVFSLPMGAIINAVATLYNSSFNSAPPPINVNSTSKSVELIEVWCDLSWQIYLPPYCMDQQYSPIFPCFIPKGEMFAIVVTGKFSWAADPHYYVYYLPDDEAFIEAVEKINNGSYYCEVNKHNLAQTYPRGLSSGSGTPVWYEPDSYI